MGIQGEFFETPEPAVPVILDEEASADVSTEYESTEYEPTEAVIGEQPTAEAAEVVAEASANTDEVESDKGQLETTIATVAPAATMLKPVKRGLKDLSIPKLYYSISEVSRLTALEPYVLRYWETEFDELRPQKNRAGNRIYSNKDIKFILRIKELLREQRYTIEGAKHILKEERQAERERPSPVEATAPDPDQIVLPTEPKPTPKLTVSLAEIHDMKASLTKLRSVLQQAR